MGTHRQHVLAKLISSYLPFTTKAAVLATWGINGKHTFAGLDGKGSHVGRHSVRMEATGNQFCDESFCFRQIIRVFLIPTWLAFHLPINLVQIRLRTQQTRSAHDRPFRQSSLASEQALASPGSQCGPVVPRVVEEVSSFSIATPWTSIRLSPADVHVRELVTVKSPQCLAPDSIKEKLLGVTRTNRRFPRQASSRW